MLFFRSRNLVRISILTACCWGQVLAIGCAMEPDESVLKKSEQKQPANLSSAENLLQQEKNIRRKLQQTTSFGFEDMPLNEALEQFGRQHDIDVVLDENSLKEEGVSRDQPVSLKLKDVSLQTGLKHLLYPLELMYIIQGESIVVCSLSHAEDDLQVRIYPVRDLIEFKDGSGSLQNDADVLVALITSTIQPITWDEVGGPGSLGIQHGLLTINQTDDVLWEVEELLAALRKLPPLNSTPQKSSPQRVRTSGIDPQSTKCQAILNQVISLDFEETPLEEVVSFLRERTGVTVFVDEKALKQEGVGLDSPISIKTKSLSLRAAFRLALRPHHLVLTVADDMLVLTSQQATEYELATILYDVTDLLVLPKSPEPIDYRNAFHEIEEGITSIVRPNTWDSVGGPGSVGEYLPRGVLVISMTEEIHSEIDLYLTRLREARAKQEVGEASQLAGFDKMELLVYQLMYVPPEINEKSGLPETPALQHIDTEKLVTIIPKLLGSEVWGDGHQVSIEALKDRLIVNHNRRVQQKIERLLNQLGVGIRVMKPGEASGGLGPSSSSGGGFFNLPEDQLPREAK